MPACVAANLLKQ